MRVGLRLRLCVGLTLGVWLTLCSVCCLKRLGLGGECSKLRIQDLEFHDLVLKG